jgi:hypothetical protein
MCVFTAMCAQVAQLASHSGAHTHHHPLPTHHHSHIHHHSALVSPKLQQQQQASPTPPMASKKRMPIISKAESRRRSEALYKSLSDDAKASVADIINEVITESRWVYACEPHTHTHMLGRLDRSAKARLGRASRQHNRRVRRRQL